VARYLYGEFFEFRPQFKLWLAANHKPVIRGTDHAIWRRIRLIPFTVTIPEEERDGALPAKLRAEMPGILRWAVEGCLLWQRDGLGTPPAVRAATDGWRADSDVLGDFLDECCELGPRWVADAGALYRAYAAWCVTSGERPAIQRTFGLRLKDRGFRSTRTKAGRRWSGVRLVTQVTQHSGTSLSRPRVGESPNAASPPVTRHHVLGSGALVRIRETDGLLLVETLDGSMALAASVGEIDDPAIRQELLEATKPAARRDDLNRILDDLVGASR
jgi:phage/plasmid-associated DNA primase